MDLISIFSIAIVTVLIYWAFKKKPVINGTNNIKQMPTKVKQAIVDPKISLKTRNMWFQYKGEIVKPKISRPTKNRWLHTNNDFGRMEEGIIYSDGTLHKAKKRTEDVLKTEYEFIENNSISSLSTPVSGS